jgi:enterochelin esterase-like enzyme
VAPTFSHLPWYADHPTNKNIRQETYFLKIVLPFVERSYRVLGKPKGRLLVGFSKSGWGAFTLLVRHPELFHRAAAWDVPFMKDKPNQFGMGLIFQTQDNFTKYHLSALLKERAKLLKKTNRFVLAGSGNFRRHHQQTHALMQTLGIPHDYRVGSLKIKHHWNSGWLAEAVRLLVESGD